MRSARLLLCLLFLCFGGFAWAAPSVSLTANRTQLTLDDEFTVEVSASEVQQVGAPDLRQFDVAGRSSRSTFINGQRSVTESYTLRPRRAGTFVIPAIEGYVSGRSVISSESLTIVVGEPKPAAPVSAEEALSLERFAQEELFVRWALPRTTAYVGEPIPMTLELWVREDLSVHSPDLVKASQLDGLLVEDLPQSEAPKGQPRTISGRRFLVFSLLTKLATPLKVGAILIDESTLRLSTSEGGFFSSTRRQTRSTPVFSIDVLEPPTTGRPSDFSPRNIGVFRLTAQLLDDRGQQATRIQTGQRLILRATVEGKGNIQSITAPKLSGIEGFEIAELSGSTEDSIQKSAEGMSGARVFQWIVSAQSPGNRQAPTLTFTSFNPDTKRYDSQQALGTALEVTGTALAKDSHQLSHDTGEDVGPIFEEAALTGLGQRQLLLSPFYLLALFLAPLTWLGLSVWRRRQEHHHSNATQRASKHAYDNAKKRLRAVETASREGLVQDVYDQLARTLKAYLEERANIPVQGLRQSELRKLCLEVGYPSELIEQLIAEMENCDYARFSPTGKSQADMREAHERVSKLLAQLNTFTPTRRP